MQECCHFSATVAKNSRFGIQLATQEVVSNCEIWKEFHDQLEK